MGGRRSGGTRLEQVGLGRDEDAEASDSGLAHRLDRQLKSDVAKRLLRCADVGSRTGCVVCGYCSLLFSVNVFSALRSSPHGVERTLPSLARDWNTQLHTQLNTQRLEHTAALIRKHLRVV